MTKSSSASGASSALARRYAASFIDVATRAGALDAVERDVASLVALLTSSSDFCGFISNPLYSKDRQFAVVGDLVKKASYHQLLINFLGVLVHNRRLAVLPEMLRAFAAEMAERRGVVEAKVRVAAPMSGDQENELRTMLSQSIHKTVVLSIQVDPSIIGGMVVSIGSHMIDDSISSKLARLKFAMTANSNSINVSTQEVV